MKYLKKGMYTRKLENGSYDDKYGQNVKFWEWGSPPHQGTNSNLQTYVDKIMVGQMSMRDVLVEDAMCFSRHSRALNAAAAAWTMSPLNQERGMPQCYFYVGPSGCGKSRKVFEITGIEGTYRPSLEEMKKGWGWDHYDNTVHDDIVIDDVNGNFTFKFGLVLMDRYPMTVGRRYEGPTPFKAKRIFFTSTKRPEEIWAQSLAQGESFKQWYRRCKLMVWDEDAKEFIEDEDPERSISVQTAVGAYATTFRQ